VTFFTLIFNGYLTWRPIVTYDALYQLDFRIFTVPIEDFFFGYALLIICTSLFEKMLVKKNHIT
jgi:lycopene cyclase domain-containing protein